MVHPLLARENGIFVKQCREWFDVNGTYRFESVALLYISFCICLSLYLKKIVLFDFFPW